MGVESSGMSDATMAFWLEALGFCASVSARHVLGLMRRIPIHVVASPGRRLVR